MALLGQASGGWTESSSALRILHVGIRNTVGVLTTDSFTQTNPVCINSSGAFSSEAGMSTATLGVLGGSWAFTRPDGGSNEIGGPANTGAVANIGAAPAGITGNMPLGVFINTAVGNAYENTPGPASGKGPYLSGQGTYANSLFESQSQAAGFADLTYTTGDQLYCSVNGYTTNQAADDYMLFQPDGLGATVLAILKMPADAVQAEIVYDQRI
jgi:hypothetical protein